MSAPVLRAQLSHAIQLALVRMIPYRLPDTFGERSLVYSNCAEAALATVEDVAGFEVDLPLRLREEEEAHAALQVRCFEGFPSASDGIFDWLANVERQRADLLEALRGVEWGGTTCCSDSFCRACGESRTVGHSGSCPVASAIAKATGR